MPMHGSAVPSQSVAVAHLAAMSLDLCSSLPPPWYETQTANMVVFAPGLATQGTLGTSCAPRNHQWPELWSKDPGWVPAGWGSERTVPMEQTLAHTPLIAPRFASEASPQA